MSEASHQDRHSLIWGAAAFLLLSLSWYWALAIAPSEEHQGEVYRIIYVHVPSAFTAFLSSAVLLIFSLWTLFKRDSSSGLWAKAVAEVGLLYTIITLATGSIWGRPTWGVWWTWDARLTTTLVMALLYAGYLIFHNSLATGPQRDRISAALGIVIAVNVPIIYKSVTWWRTLHQPPSIMRQGGSSMAPEMLYTILFCLLASLVTASWLMSLRVKNLKLQQDIEQRRFAAHS